MIKRPTEPLCYLYTLYFSNISYHHRHHSAALLLVSHNFQPLHLFTTSLLLLHKIIMSIHDSKPLPNPSSWANDGPRLLLSEYVAPSTIWHMACVYFHELMKRHASLSPLFNDLVQWGQDLFGIKFEMRTGIHHKPWNLPEGYRPNFDIVLASGTTQSKDLREQTLRELVGILVWEGNI